MSRTIYATRATGLTLYAKPSPTSATPAWDTDVVSLAENGTTGEYSATVGDGPHRLYQQAGGSPASSDKVIGVYDAAVVLASNYTATRAGYLDKLNVSGTLAHSDAANTYKADVSGLSTLTATQVWEHATRSLTTFGSLVSDIWSAGSRTLTAIGDSAGVTTLLERILGIIRTAADDVTAETAQTTANRDGLATATNVSDAQTAIETILGTPTGASIAADIAAIELEPEIIVNPTELSNESIEAIDEYFWENHRFKATIDSETGQFVIWVKNEDGDKIATLAKQEEIIEDIAGIEGGGGLTGDYTLTVTVTDDADSEPIEGATVTLYRSGERGAEATDGDGEAVFGVDAATWTWIVRASGYASQTGTKAIAANDTLAVELVAIVTAPPTDPNNATLRVTCIGEDSQIDPGAVVRIRMIEAPTDLPGFGFDGSESTFTADANGIAEREVTRGATYEIRREGTYKQWQQYVMPTDEDLIELDSFVQP
jgi:hypothetical protein